MAGNKINIIDEIRCYAPSKTIIKIALIGDGSTGKTSYFDRILMGDSDEYKFSKNYNATKGCNICQMELMIGKFPVTVHIFDTAGQEKFGALRDSYLMGVDGIILMYDITNKETKNNVLARWLPDIKRLLDSTKARNYVPIMVVGNKYDRKETVEDTLLNPIGIRTAALVGSYGKKYGSINHCHISVKADNNMMEPINWLLKNILSYYLPVNAKKSKKTPNVIYSN